MELKLPMVVVHRARRLVEAWVPGIPAAYKIGPSLAEIRDDLALAVMERFEAGPAEQLGQFQLPPHVSLKMVSVETVAHDRARNRRLPLKARIGVLVEKWPDDDFHVVTPTRLPQARFALNSVTELEPALARRLGEYCIANDLDSLDALHAEQRERLEILEVDADPPSIFPKGVRLRKKTRASKRGKHEPSDETPAQREERRRMRRMHVRTLRAIARNLTHGAMDDTLHHAYGREAIVRDVLDAIDGREGVSIVLIGPPGTGKTAIVHEVVRRLHVRHAAANTRRDVWRVDGHRFIAGMSFVGQWEARARELIDELTDLGDVLHLDELLSIVFAGRTRKGSTNLAQFLEPHMARGELSILAESTAERFDRVREESPTFAAQFRIVHVPPLDDRATLPVLLGVMRELEGGEDALGVRVSPEALESVLQLSRRFMAHEAFPGKAVRLLRAAVGDHPGPRSIARGAVIDAVRRQTGLPNFVLGSEKPRSRDMIRMQLTAMVAGQPEAIDAVTDMIVSLQHALGDPEKPLATFLFVGPTGVGKTETAKAMARFLFGSDSRLVRFDMSEFQSTASVSRLVGHPDAPDGELTLALRTQPFCVVLFDEVEKAHPRVFDALLQLLGEGRLTDAAGRTADARQAVIVMTSNLGVREAVDRTGFVRDDADESRKHYVAAVRAFFRPEFFNRIDRVIPFDPLGPDALRVVVEHALGDLLARRGIQRGNVMVDVERELLDLLVEQAYDPRYGARPLRRALERRLAVPLAHHLVRRESNDLALVQLFRRGADMALSVRALRDDARIPAEDDPTAWSGSRVFEVFAEIQRDLEAVRAGAAIEQLEDIRLEALRAAATNPRIEATSVIDLLERLEAFATRVRDLGDGDLSDAHYETREVKDGYDIDDRHSDRRARKGLRPRTRVVEIPLVPNLDAIAHRARATVAALRDELTILAHQIRAAAARGLDRYVVCVEPVTPKSMMHVASVGRMVHFGFARATWLNGHTENGVPSWTAAQLPFERITRHAVVLEGFGLRELLDDWSGYHIGLHQLPTGPVAMLAETTVVEGAGVEALEQHDRRRAAEHERRRRGDLDDATRAERVVTRTIENVQRHLATHLAAHAHDAIAAAMLRHRAQEVR
jgi:ATP-dependent Clp protease ATP-binding subunit ClpC